MFVAMQSGDVDQLRGFSAAYDDGKCLAPHAGPADRSVSPQSLLVY